MNIDRVFLSHAGEDHTTATSLAVWLRSAFGAIGIPVEIFNTSEPAHRFEELQERLRLGVDWTQTIERWRAELFDYLRSNIEGSRCYILLVTQTSIAKNSEWISYEMNVAHEIAPQKGLFFFPCTIGVPLYDLPGVALRFQGVELDADVNFEKVLVGLSRIWPGLAKGHA